VVVDVWNHLERAIELHIGALLGGVSRVRVTRARIVAFRVCLLHGGPFKIALRYSCQIVF